MTLRFFGLYGARHSGTKNTARRALTSYKYCKNQHFPICNKGYRGL
jgi:hypothetical protein